MFRIFLLTIITIAVLLSCEWPWDKKTSSRDFYFSYSVELEPTNGERLELWLPIPQTNEVQQISNFKIDTQGMNYEIKDEEKHDNKYLYIYSNDGTHDTKTINLSFNVKREEHQIENYKNINPKNYLGSYTMVPTGEPFNRIIENNNLNNNNLRDLYDFVLSGMHYGKPKSIDNKYYHEPWLSKNKKYGNNKVSRDYIVNLYQDAAKTNSKYTFGNGNSLYACDIGVGNCTDYHSYFISLSRTMEIPARFHMGFPIPSGDEGAIGGYHCWADYYIEGKGWHPVDISEADKDSEKIDYFFGTVCNNRVEFITGRDFDLEGYENNPVNLFIYPLLEINDNKSDSFKKSFYYKSL